MRFQDDQGCRSEWHPPLWIALVFCCAFAVAAIVAAFLGQPAHVVAVLAGLFVVSFNRVFAHDGVVAVLGDVLKNRQL